MVKKNLLTITILIIIITSELNSEVKINCNLSPAQSDSRNTPLCKINADRIQHGRT